MTMMMTYSVYSLRVVSDMPIESEFFLVILNLAVSFFSGEVRRSPEIGPLYKSDYVSVFGQKTKKKFSNLLESPPEMLKNPLGHFL